MPRKILIATDGSDLGRKALDMAIELCLKLGGELTVLHVHLHGRPVEELARMAEVEHMVSAVADEGGFPLPAGQDRIQQLMSAARQDLERFEIVTRIGDLVISRAIDRAEDAGLKQIETRTASGDYADAILEAAEEIGPDMIVMGSRGLGRLRELILGSVSHKVAQQAPCTVVLVK